ncbi:MAG TPA: hypothetical protein VH475_12690 [Tepidisphaeraceae bacterium]
MRAGDARGAIKIAEVGDLLGFWRETFFIFRVEGVAPRALWMRNKIAECCAQRVVIGAPVGRRQP